jgi:hypothetical protein
MTCKENAAWYKQKPRGLLERLIPKFTKGMNYLKDISLVIIVNRKPRDYDAIINDEAHN